MRLSRFVVTKLLGQFNHEVNFFSRERITIIHGPNGVGKTSLLRLVDNFLNPYSMALREIQFSKIEARFGKNVFLTITKDSNESLEYRFKERRKEFQIIFGCVDPLRSKREKSRRIPAREIEMRIPHLKRVGPTTWWDPLIGERLDRRSIQYNYSDVFADPENETLPDWLLRLAEDFNTRFIRTQRLRNALRNDRTYHHREPQDSITEISDDLAELIQTQINKSGLIASSLDRNFPNRILSSNTPNVTAEKVKEKYAAQQKWRSRLMNVGLLASQDTVPLPETKIEGVHKKVLWTYLKDVEKKFKIHNDTLEKLELFKKIVDDKNFINKTFHLDKDQGFYFKGFDGKPIPRSSLSSGEQHELILIYLLIFKSTKNQMVLIDEPELSLHVTWQKSFLDDMEEISKLSELDFLIATHSPTIVSKRSHLMIPLSGE